MLDTFPWCGHTTTCEALWMGAPVLTLRGDRHAGRMGASLLTHMGLPEWIVESRTTYAVEAAQRVADLASLRQLRSELRRWLLSSPLCHAKRYAAGIEAAYRRMWRQWIETNESHQTASHPQPIS